MAQNTGGQVDTVMQERRLFPPTAEFAAKARIGSLAEYEALWNEANEDTESFWGELAAELRWFKPYFKSSRMERAVCQVVRRRADERLV